MSKFMYPRDKKVDFEKYNADKMDELEVYYGLPRKVRFCKKCVSPNQNPISDNEFQHNIQRVKRVINFDENDICDACKWAEMKKRVVDWKQREQEHRQ